MPLKILVVDDEPDLEILMRQRFRRRLRSRDLEFLFAGDGMEALQALDLHDDVDIVLTDINMPRMDGLTLLGKIRELERLLKVVIVSAYGDMGNIRTAMNRGAFDFVTKPIDFDDLELTIEKTYREVNVLRQALFLQEQLSAIQRELEIASRIQLSALPCKFPAFPDRADFDLYATMIPAQEVGGDFYDFFLVDEDRLGFVIGDVSGKGIGAAMFMAITRTLLRATALLGMNAAECVRYVNRVLYPESMPQMFVTAVYGILNTHTGEVSYANAGHLSPILARANGEVLTLERTGGLGLCLTSEFVYHTKKVALEPYDSLLLFTDGVTEAVGKEREQFSAERLLQVVGEANSRVPAELIRFVLREVDAFSGGAGQADDITILALQYYGPRSSAETG